MLTLMQLPDIYANALIIIGVLLIAAVIISGAFYGLVLLNRKWLTNGTNPALIFLAHQAITLAYKMSDTVFDVVDERLHELEKREIISYVYDLLPATIKMVWLPFEIDWKDYISKQQFLDFVSAEYDKLVEQFHTVKEELLNEMLEELAAENSTA